MKKLASVCGLFLTCVAVAGSTPLYQVEPAVGGPTHPVLDASGATQPISAASGDFNGDGVVDLVCGYTGPAGHAVAVHLGNIDAVFPHRPEARARRASGEFRKAPFGPAVRVREVPGRPDFLVAGDFDADDNWDVVVAEREGRTLQFLAGRGDAGLSEPESRSLAGAVSALVGGQVNRADSLLDIAVGVRETDTSAVLVFEGPEGAWRSTPERLLLPAPADAISFGRVAGDPAIDVIVAAGAERIIFEGRDRHLTSTSKRRADVAPPGMSRVPMEESAGSSLPVSVVSRLELPEPPIAVLPMRLNPDAMTDFILLVEGAPVSAAISVVAATITVDSAADNAIAGDLSCTLREAIKNANIDGDTTGGDCTAGAGADTIEFDIGGGGAAATIALSTGLPSLTNSTTVNGNSQACTDPPCIELNGELTNDAEGLSLLAEDSVVRGLAINDFDRNGIRIESSGNFVEGNYIGTDRTGTIPGPNGIDGILVSEGGRNTIGGTSSGAANVISANGSTGVRINEGAENVVLGNLIGTDAMGSSTPGFGNHNNGVDVRNASANVIGGAVPGARNVISANSREIRILWTSDTSTDNLVLGNLLGTDVSGTVSIGTGDSGIYLASSLGATVGGTTANARNVISGNRIGIEMSAMARNTLILGNYIGTDASGGEAIGNTQDGIRGVEAPDPEIGGAVPGARNVISGSGESGIHLISPVRAQILGNYIGTDADGVERLPNDEGGILLTGSAGPGPMAIGGTDPGAGNLISGNTLSGVSIQGDSPTLRVLGNLIGTDHTGLVPLGNLGNGVRLFDADNILVGGTEPGARNVISGNFEDGVLMEAGTGNSRVEGNFIGLDRTGTAPIGNLRHGVSLVASSNNVIGGTGAGAANVISANEINGVSITAGNPGTDIAVNNRVEGNLIGTDVTGTIDVGDAQSIGVRTRFADGTIIGGTETGAGNVISGHPFSGIDADPNSTIQGNRIGVDITGMVPLGNENGILVKGPALVGGATPGAGNVISGNTNFGVLCFGDTGMVLQGNLVGPDASGMGLIGNGGTGVSCSYSADPDGNLIGGASEKAGNRIAGNGGAGIVVTGTNGMLERNSIFANELLGIDLNADGVTLNDPMDPDTGPNTGQNFPVLNFVDATPAGITVEGFLNSVPNSQYQIEFFASAACDPSGHGEGDRFLGSLVVLTDSLGDATFNAPMGAGATDGEAITATASVPEQYTSEFSECVEVQCNTSVPFAQTVIAQDKNTLTWPLLAAVRLVKGDLDDVSSYLTSGTGWANRTSVFDISFDQPDPEEGLYYLVRPLACGSWQTAVGDEPGRDATLP